MVMSKKKYISIFLIVLLLIGLFAFLWNKTSYTLHLPQFEELDGIVLVQESLKEELNQEAEMKDLLALLEEGRCTKKESVSDVPVNADEVIKIELSFKEGGESIVYAYRNNHRFYLEQPYNGIYSIREDEYEDIKRFFD